MNGKDFQGNTIRVDYSITKEAHKPTPGVYFHHGKYIYSMASKPIYTYAGLEPVLSHTEKSRIASYYRQITNVNIKFMKYL